MPDGHHNIVKNGDYPQRPTSIEKCSQHSSGNADETIETSTTTLEHVSKWHAPPAHRHTPNCWALSLLQLLEELGTEIALAPTPPSEVPPTTHNIVDHLTANGSKKTANNDRDTSHRGPSGSTGQELDSNGICTRETIIQIKSRGQHHLRPQGHHNQADDDVPTRR